MEYRCPVCGQVMTDDLKAYVDHTERHIVAEIRKRHPEWVDSDGVCRKCLEHFRREMRGE